MKSGSINLQSVKRVIGKFMASLKKYSTVLVFLIFTGVYGYLIIQINTLSNPAVEDEAVEAEAKAVPTPRIDEDAAAKLESLKDNSVNVQTLFEQGRTNPFEE